MWNTCTPRGEFCAAKFQASVVSLRKKACRNSVGKGAALSFSRSGLQMTAVFKAWGAMSTSRPVRGGRLEDMISFPQTLGNL